MNQEIYEEANPEEYEDASEEREAVTEDREDEQYRSPTEYYFGNTDPYLKPTFQLTDCPRKNYWIAEDGSIHTKNLSAYWIPELTITEEISGTVYTVTGSYEGTGDFIRKLERIIAKNFSEKMEDSQ